MWWMIPPIATFIFRQWCGVAICRSPSPPEVKVLLWRSNCASNWEYAELVSELGEQRRLILATQPAGDARKKLLHELAQQGLELASSGNEQPTVIREESQISSDRKSVYLVGAGPGDPELLTVKAHKLLRSADVILHDELVSEEILQLARPDATLINVGKRHGEKRVTQEQIHTLLLHFGSQKLIVVRLKGGDPLIFGRAAEEMQALEAAGIDFEIVPGVTAALAAALLRLIIAPEKRIPTGSRWRATTQPSPSICRALTMKASHRGWMPPGFPGKLRV